MISMLELWHDHAEKLLSYQILVNRLEDNKELMIQVEVLTWSFLLIQLDFNKLRRLMKWIGLGLPEMMFQEINKAIYAGIVTQSKWELAILANDCYVVEN